MISFAAADTRENVLASFAKAKGTEKDTDTEAFHSAVAEAVKQEVDKIPAENTRIALEVKARAAADKSGSIQNIKIIAYPLRESEK
jgi:hypothetical protein